MFHEKGGKNFFGGWEKYPVLDPRDFVGGRLERIGISAGRFRQKALAFLPPLNYYRYSLSKLDDTRYSVAAAKRAHDIVMMKGCSFACTGTAPAGCRLPPPITEVWRKWINTMGRPSAAQRPPG